MYSNLSLIPSIDLFRKITNQWGKKLKCSDEVIDAIEQQKPIVVLESTILSHGLPYPQNLKTGKELENIIRENGACPATIAIIEGQVKIGLEHEELADFIQRQDVIKASSRDVPIFIAQNKTAATTVAGTLYLANLLNIRFFVTGGIGGVHRQAEFTFDISSDLIQLAKTPILTICAGAKSILDIPKTLEYLETLGVPVLGYRTAQLPAFYSATSPYLVSHRIDDLETLAELMLCQWQNFNESKGFLLANPLDKEEAMAYEDVESQVTKALELANTNNIKGKEVTPFLLSYLNNIPNGRFLTTNQRLVKNNAELGACAAVHFYRLLNRLDKR